MKLINIGFGNMVSASRLVAIVSPESAPIKRVIQDARESGTLIDATYGRRTRAVIITDSDHIILSAVQPEKSKPFQPSPQAISREAALARRAPLFSAEKSTLSGQRASGRESPDAGKRQHKSKMPAQPSRLAPFAAKRLRRRHQNPPGGLGGPRGD